MRCSLRPSTGVGELLSRCSVLAVVLLASLALARRALPGGEAFWLLFPVWVLAARCLGLVRTPALPGKGRRAKVALPALLVVIPVALYLWIAWMLGGRISVPEVLISVYFFAVSLEMLLLYVFAGARRLEAMLVRALGGAPPAPGAPEAGSALRRKAGKLAAVVSARAVLYALLVPFLFATFSVHRVKVPPGPPDPADGPLPEAVEFPSRGERPMRLKGWFFPLKGAAGTVLACHGVGANRADLADFIWLLRDAGFQVLTFDFRAHGESEGHTVTYGAREREDVLGAWDHLVSRADVDRTRIVGFGVSMGAASLLLALPDLPEMRAAVADSSFADLEQMALYQYRFLPGFLARPLAALTLFFGELEVGLDPRAFSPLRAVERVRLPLFFIHGSRDVVVPEESTRRLHDAYAGPKLLRIEPEAGHGETAALDPVRYRRDVRKFYLGALGPVPGSAPR